MADNATGKPEKQDRLPDGRFPKGVSGNPKGRPKVPRPSVARSLRALLDLPPDELQKPRPADTVCDRVAQALLIAALTGGKDRVAAIRTTLERIDGAVPQVVAQTSDDELTRFILDLGMDPAANGNGSGDHA